MQKFIATLLLSSALNAHAQQCPQLEGTFRCRDSQPFDLAVTQEMQNGYMSYTMADPSGDRTFVVDGQPHELILRKGTGTYTAHCYGVALLLALHTPEGDVNDRYYIERAALVRVRIGGPTQVSSLSCAPTHGTWRLYRH